MVDFATTTDMVQRSQGEITTTSHPFLQKELAAATRTIREACGWHIATAQVITRKIRSRHWHEVWVPAMEISSVKITTIDGVEHVLADADFDPVTGWTSWSGDRYDLECMAGYTNVPEDLVTLTLELAAGALGTSLGITREQAGGVSITYGRNGGALAPSDHARLTAYKLGRLP